MGSPVSSVMAGIFMKDFESKFLAKFKAALRLWKTFVDVISVIEKGKEGEG